MHRESLADRLRAEALVTDRVTLSADQLEAAARIMLPTLRQGGRREVIDPPPRRRLHAI